MLCNIVLLFLLALSSSIYIEESIPMELMRRQHGWTRLSSVILDEGEGSLSVSVQLANYLHRDYYQLQLVLLTEAQYAREKLMHCSVKQSQVIVKVVMDKANHFKFQNLQAKFQLEETQRIILVLRDCDSTLINEYFNKNAFLQVSIDIQIDESHLTSEHYFDFITFPTQIALLIYLIREARKRKTDISDSSDICQSLQRIAKIQIVSLILLGVTCIQRSMIGTYSSMLLMLCFGMSETVEVLLSIMLLNLCLGWKVHRRTKILASQSLYVWVTILLWIIINGLSLHKKIREYDTIFNDLTQLLNDLILIICVLALVFRFKQTKKNQGEFYKKILFLCLCYFLSGHLSDFISQTYEMEQEFNFKLSFVCLANTIALSYLMKLIVLKNNIFQKVAMTRHSANGMIAEKFM